MSSDDDDDDYFSSSLLEIDQKIKDSVKEISEYLEVLNSKKEKLDWDEEKDSHASDVLKFLKEALMLFHSGKGVEKFFLPHAGEFREQNGIRQLSAVCKECICCQEPQSSDELDLSNIAPMKLWEYFIDHLQKYSLEQLQLHQFSGSSISTDLICMKNHVRFLKNIYEPDLSWTLYQRHRVSLLENENSSCSECCFKCFLQDCLHNICIDQMVVYMGEFHPANCSWTEIFSPYFTIVVQKLTGLLQMISKWPGMKSDVPIGVKRILECRNSGCFEELCSSCILLKSSNHQLSVLLEKYLKEEDYGASTKRDFDILYSMAVLRVVKAIFNLEYQVKMLENGKMDVFDYVHAHEFNMKLVSENVGYTLPSDSPVASPLHEKDVESVAVDLDTFSKRWRFCFTNNGLLNKMQKILQEHLQSVVQSSILKEQTALLENGILSVFSNRACDAHYSASMQMKFVLPSVLETVAGLENFFPLLCASMGPFLPFRSSFCHAVNTYLMEVLANVKHFVGCSSQRPSIYHIYVALTSAMFAKDFLSKYKKCMEEKRSNESNNQLRGAWDMAGDLVSSLKEAIYLEHMKYLECGIMFDAESYDFSDTKPFFEGERVSFSIQMWNLYMRGLLTDVQCYLPQQAAQEVYRRVLCDSLLYFANRYGQSSPSEARTPQVQTDVLTLLLCVSELIVHACDTASQLIGKDSFHENLKSSIQGSQVTKIHSLCCTLLSVLAVLTSPITDIYKVFAKGFPLPSLAVRTKYSSITPWLPWIRNNLFPEPGNNLLMSTVSVWLAVSVCTSWQVPSPTAVIKAFTVHQCALSTLIMSQASHIPEDNPGVDSEVKEQKIKLAFSVFKILSNYDSHVDLVSNVLLPVIERTDGWKEFDKAKLSEPLSERPWWYQGLMRVFDTYYESVLQNLFPLLLQWKELFGSDTGMESWKKIRKRFESFVTCTCDNSLTSYHEEMIKCPFSCVLSLLESLNTYLFIVPSPIKWCLSTLDEYFENYVSDANPIQHSITLQVIISTLISHLCDLGLLETVTGHSLVESERLLLSSIVETLKSIVVKSIIPPELTAEQMVAVERHLLHILTHFKKFRISCEKSKQDMAKKNSLEDEMVKISCEALLRQSDGLETILYLQKVLCINESWIRNSLGIPDILSSSVFNTISPDPLQHIGDSQCEVDEFGDVQHEMLPDDAVEGASQEQEERNDSKGRKVQHIMNRTFTKDMLKDMVDETLASEITLNLDVSNYSFQRAPDFNPLEHFGHLGKCKFNDAVKSMPAIPWEALLSHLPIFGLTEVGFASLLSRRWDIRGEGPVSEEQRLIIHELRAKYNIS